MCIKSCKPLNPSAQEWRPPHHHHIPAPAPSQAAAAAAVASQPPQKLLWKLPFYHPISFHQGFLPYFPRAWSRTLHFSTPLSVPATGRIHVAAAQPVSGGERNYDDQPVEKKGLESCVGELDGRPIVHGRNGASRMWRLRRLTAPPPRREWKLRSIDGGSEVDGGCSAASSPLSRTTVMIRNIPNQLRRDFMLEFLDSYCRAHSLEYDFMYLPMDFIKGDNLGYAFVNFTSEENALKFKEILQYYKWGNVKTEEGYFYMSKKICVVTWATIQGKERLVKRFEEAIFACDNMDFLPVAFDPPRGRGGSNATPVIVGRLKAANKHRITRVKGY